MDNALLIKHQQALESLCQKYHVSRLEVFGSAVRGDFDPISSDVDLLVEFDQSANSAYFDNYFGLKEGIESTLDRPIDLLSVDALKNPYFIERIADERRLLYAA